MDSLIESRFGFNTCVVTTIFDNFCDDVISLFGGDEKIVNEAVVSTISAEII